MKSLGITELRIYQLIRTLPEIDVLGIPLKPQCFIPRVVRSEFTLFIDFQFFSCPVFIFYYLNVSFFNLPFIQ